MTLPATARRAGPFTGNGVTTSFPFTFKVFATADVLVTIADAAGVITVKTLNSDYSVTLNADQEATPGGTITYPLSGASLPAGSKLAVIGDLDYNQPLDLPSGGNFSPTSLENQLDRATMQIQQLKELSDRSAKMSVYSSNEDVEALTSGIIVLAEISDGIAAVAADLANVDIVATGIGNVSAVGGSIASVNAVAADLANIDTVANDLNEPVSEINAVGENISSVNTVASNITAVNTVAGNLSTWRDVTAGDDIQVTNFSGTGAQTAFVLPFAPGAENNTQVFISGVYQQKDQYTVSGATIAFSSAPPSGTNNIEVVWSRPFVLGATDSALVGYQPAGTGAVATTVQAQLRRTQGLQVHLKDAPYYVTALGITDDRAAIETCINAVAASGGGSIYWDDGTYLINSFSSDATLATAHGQILPIKANVHHVFSPGAKIVVGSFFDDKPFILFSGFNAALTANFTYIANVTFDGINASFSGASSIMRTAYRRRIAIEFGKITDGKVINGKFSDGDLSNVIASGYGGFGERVIISGNEFIDVVQENANNSDHTTCYIGTRNSSVTGNIFRATTTQARKVACAVEMHNSNQLTAYNAIENYTRAVWFSAQSTEAPYCTNQAAIGNIAQVTNAFAYLWADNGCSIGQIAIQGNTVVCNHIAGESALYNGFQGLIGSSNPNSTGNTADVKISGNLVKIGSTVTAGCATAIYMERPFTGLHITENTFIGATDGVKFTGSTKAVDTLQIKNNTFQATNPGYRFFNILASTMSFVEIENNTFRWTGTAPYEAIYLGANGLASNCSVKGNNYPGVSPTNRELTYTAGTNVLPGLNNHFAFRLYTTTLSHPALTANAVGIAQILNVPTDCVTFGSGFEWLGDVPGALTLATTTSAHDAGYVKLICGDGGGGGVAAASGFTGQVMVRLG